MDEEKIRGALLANCIETLNQWTTGELLFLNHFGKPQQGKRIKQSILHIAFWKMVKLGFTAPRIRRVNAMADCLSRN